MLKQTERPRLLHAENLGFKQGDRWLFRNLSFELYLGEFLAILGPSGVGKSTLLDCLNGALEPTEGKISVFTSDKASEDFEKTEARTPNQCSKQFGIIYQALRLSANNNSLTNVMCGRLARYSWRQTLFGFSRADKSEAYRFLDDLGVGAYAYKPVYRLSGGEKQRVAVARALFQQPLIYFADEPVSNLDTYYAGRVLGKLRLEGDSMRAAVICVLHQADLIQRFADVALSLNSEHPEKWNWRIIRNKRERSRT